ncbi:hypothetical protein T4C_3469 [Trichinella pseudospiralis]|uniref:Uncharacterized protein n=1 Tax=Trichinella pseudospiralis TaxID=6337 RepID=A0A0V1GHC9_TRIPS|nr:hypothetical protein T4C_3469 [Trichinella pseudospiralis]
MLYLTIKVSETGINKAEGGSMEFYMDLNEKCNVHGDDFKNRLLTIFT